MNNTGRNPHRRDSLRFTTIILSAFLTCIAVAHAGAQPTWNELQKLNASDARPNIGFGDATVLSNGIGLVGATANGTANVSAGAVYVIRWNEAGATWEETQILSADDGELDERFGWSIDLSGAAAIIGAPDDDDAGTRSGSAYVFRMEDDVWQQEQKLTAGDGAAQDRFGRTVAINGDVAVVGAPEADGAGGPTGAAYVFRREDGAWTMEQKLQVGTFSTIADFGAAVSASGDRILIGVPDAGPGAQNLGAAYVFRYDQDEGMWLEEQALSASDQDPQDKFGSSVDLDGEVAIIGARQDDQAGAFAGSAYVFRWNEMESSWQEEQNLIGDDVAEDDHFGSVVAINGDIAVVGSPDHDHEGGQSAGAVYVFEFDGAEWEQRQKLTASDAGIGDHFGESVAIDEELHLLIGASNADDGGESAGSAYIFTTEPTGTAVEETPDASTLTLLSYPNPFRDETRVSYTLSELARVRLTVFDILGRAVKELVDERQSAGEHLLTLDLTELPAGVYLLRLDTNRSVESLRLVRTGS